METINKLLNEIINALSANEVPIACHLAALALIILEMIYLVRIKFKFKFRFKWLIERDLNGFVNGYIKEKYFKAFPTDRKLVETIKRDCLNNEENWKKEKGKSNKIINNRVEPKNIEDYINGIRFYNITGAAFHNPSVILSVILDAISITAALFSILLAIWITCIGNNFQLIKTIIFYLAIFVIIWQAFRLFNSLLNKIPNYLKAYIKHLPLQEYSSLIKNQMNESEMISFISYKIWELGNSIQIEIDKSYKLDGKLITLRNLLINPSEKEQLSSAREISIANKVELFKNDVVENEIFKRLNEVVNDKEKEIQKIKSLIEECSARFCIPEIEISEHLFQFSPILYWDWLKKLIRNIEAIIKIANSNNYDNYDADSLLLAYSRSILYESYRFVERIDKINYYQCQNISFHDLHNDIIDMVSSNSSSEASRIYVSLLSNVAKQLLDKCPNKEIYNGLVTKENVYTERLKYVFIKRKMHIGLDLHYSAHHALHQILEKDKSLDADKVKKISDQLSITGFNCLSGKEKYPRGGLNNGIEYKSMQLIRDFYINKLSLLEDSKNKLEINFKDRFYRLLDDWNVLGKEGNNLIVLTFGYSKFVRHILKNVFATDKRLENKYRLFVFLPEDEQKLDARQIKYQLTEQGDKKLSSVLVSYPEFIIPLLSEKSRILVLMGAEAYDKKNRVIRTNKYKQDLIKFLKEARWKILKNSKIKLKNADVCLNPKEMSEMRHEGFHQKFYEKCRIWACTESSKYKDDLNDIKALFNNQYDALEVYGPLLISDVITDKREDDN